MDLAWARDLGVGDDLVYQGIGVRLIPDSHQKVGGEAVPNAVRVQVVGDLAR